MPIASCRFRQFLGTAVATALLGVGAVAVDIKPAAAAYPVPPTPAGLTAAIEAPQPYVGQALCDPVAKPGVTAFRDLLLKTYPGTGSSGIVRDCGAGGQSEHKEGRAFDWRVSAYNTQQKGQADALVAWLVKTDAYGNTAAMARRLGIMYVIWNKQIWKSYDPTWKAYSGASAHTDHVHFSFGWNGAKKVTSYWDGTVAAFDLGPRSSPRVSPVRTLSNLPVRRTYAATSLRVGSTGNAVRYLQKRLGVVADGDYGGKTAHAVGHFQNDQRLTLNMRWGLKEWHALLPLPQSPLAQMDPPGFVLGNLVAHGWALDLDTTSPIQLIARVDGGEPQQLTANLPRDDVQRDYPEWGAEHGFALALPVPDGTHTVCLTALNAAGTPGAPTPLGCREVTAQHSPIGALEAAETVLGVVRIKGWALDPDSADPVPASLTVNGVPSTKRVQATTRTDISAKYPGMDDQHGLEAELTLADGTHEICLIAANAPDTPGEAAPIGCRSVTVTHSPTGALEQVRRTPGGVRVSGWALDPDVVDSQPVQVLSNGQPVAVIETLQERPALLSLWPRHTGMYAFDAVIDLEPGTHEVCVAVANATGTQGTDRTLPSCREVTVSHNGAGALEYLRAAPANGRVVLAGDAYDADSQNATVVTVVVDGTLAKTLTANRASSTSAARWPGYGAARGFATSLTLSPGLHTVCIGAQNAAGTTGRGTSLGCRAVTVSKAVGRVTYWRLSGRTLTTTGWTIDPDRSAANTARLVVNGRIVGSGLATRSRTDVTAQMPGYGSAHGFRFSTTLPRGSHKICVGSLNIPGTPGTSTSLLCRSITVA